MMNDFARTTRPTSPERVLRWDSKGGLTALDHEPRADRLVVADSFLVSSGRALGLADHFARFARSGAALSDLARAEAADFWNAASAAIPEEGDWFPRFELVRAPTHRALQLRLRPAPPLRKRVRLTLWGSPDPRMQPRHKGPDLSVLSEVRPRLQEAGADEAVICTPAGRVLEGLYSAIVWWEDGVLCAPPPHWRVLPSVTRKRLWEFAKSRNISTRHVMRSPSELHGKETWALNALHGIRVAAPWEGSPWSMPRGGEERDMWQAGLDQEMEAIRSFDPGSVPEWKR